MEAHPVELLLFAREGRLSSLEIVWYDEGQKIGTFPPPEFREAPSAR
jgi:hypothetical protein